MSGHWLRDGGNSNEAWLWQAAKGGAVPAWQVRKSERSPEGRPSLYEVILEEAARIAKVKVGDKIEHIDKDGIVTALWACGVLGGRVAQTRMNKISYTGYHFPPEIIHQAIWLYLRSQPA